MKLVYYFFYFFFYAAQNGPHTGVYLKRVSYLHQHELVVIIAAVIHYIQMYSLMFKSVYQYIFLA